MDELIEEFEFFLDHAPVGDSRIEPALIRAYYGYLSSFAQATAEDNRTAHKNLVKIFRTAFKQLHRYPVGSNFKIWITKIAIDTIKRSELDRLVGMATGDWLFHRATRNKSAGIKATTGTSEDSPLQNLPINLRLPLVLRYLLGLTITETASVLKTKEQQLWGTLEEACLSLWSELRAKDLNYLGTLEPREIHMRSRQITLGKPADHEDLETQKTHLDQCEDCRKFATFVQQLTPQLKKSYAPSQAPNQEGIEELLEKIRGYRYQRTSIRRPGWEVLWILGAIVIFLLVGSLFNRIFPSYDVTEAPFRIAEETNPDPIEANPRQTIFIQEAIRSQEFLESEPAYSWSPNISLDGQWIAFASTVSNLVPGDNNRTSDVFVMQREKKETHLVSIATSGEQGNQASFNPDISEDGRYVVFSSFADNLTTDDPPTCPGWGPDARCPNIYLHDRETSTTELISKPKPGFSGNASISPIISPDGRWIVYWSAAAAIVGEASNTCVQQRNSPDCLDIYVYDRVSKTTEAILIGKLLEDTSDITLGIEISPGGELIAVSIDQADIIAQALNIQTPNEVFLYNRRAGKFESLNVTVDGNFGNGPSYAMSMSLDGRWVAFASEASDLVEGDTNERADIFLRDRLRGITERLSIGSADQTNDDISEEIVIRPTWMSNSLKISPDGRRVAFISTARNLTPDHTYTCRNSLYCLNVFLYDRLIEEIKLIHPMFIFLNPSVDLSAGGRWVTFSAYVEGCKSQTLCNTIFIYDLVSEESLPIREQEPSQIASEKTEPLFSNQIIIEKYDRQVTAVAFSPTQPIVASSSRDGTVSLHSTITRRHLNTIDDHPSQVHSLAFSPDGNLLAVGVAPDQVYLWRIPEISLRGVLRENAGLRSLAFSPDGTRLAVGGNRGVKIWDIETGSLTRTLKIPDGYATALAYLPNGELLAISSSDHTVWLKTTNDGKNVLRLGNHSDEITSVAFSADGSLLATGSKDQYANLWRISWGANSWSASLIYRWGHEDWVTSLSFSPDGRFLATGSFDNSIGIWDLETGSLLDVPFYQYQNQVLSVAISGDGERLAAGTVHGEVYLWEKLEN
jgi:WD40 repeat protein/DNA-directed RNA polymerase specialized sigma24 family protein